MNVFTRQKVEGIAHIGERITKMKSPHNAKLATIVASLSKSVEALGNIHANMNPLHTPAAHMQRVAKSGKTLAAQAESAREKLRAAVQEAAQDISSRIEAKINLKENHHAVEVRSIFRSLSPTDQVKLLIKLGDQNQGPEMAAIVSAPSYLTGISPELRDLFIEYIETKHAGAEVQERNALLNAYKEGLIATDLAISAASELSDPEKLAVIEKQERAALEADAAFDATATNA